MSESGKTLKQKAYHELKEYTIITLYLWIVFSMFIVYKSVILSENHMPLVMAHGLALINALALGKILLIARAVHLGEHANDRPLVYPTLFKSALFTVVLAIFKVLEDGLIGHYRGESLRASLADFGGGTWQGILAFSLIMWAILIPFVAFGEVERVLGEGAMARMFFGGKENG
jgi:hypothetical protein